MRRHCTTLAAALAGALLVAMPVPQGETAEQRHVKLGGGGATGIYYPAGEAICRLVNKGRKKHGLACSVERSAGSVENVDKIRAGGFFAGFAQSDVQFRAYHGDGSFAQQGPFENMRTLFSTYQEVVTIVARRETGIRSLQDLKGKRINLGNSGSGTKATAAVFLEAFGWTEDDFKSVTDYSIGDQAEALCDGKVDAIFTVVGYPSGTVEDATTSCDTLIIPVAGPAIDQLVSDSPYYAHATIPGGMYRGTESDVKTFAVVATVLSSSSADPDVVYSAVKAVFENFHEFKRMHPAFATLDKKKMVEDSLFAPLHDGAVRYYKEAGLM